MSALLSLALLLGAPAADPIGLGTLWARDEPRCPGRGQPYCPQEGDLVFFSSICCFHSFAYTCAKSGHPWHVGIIVRDACGRLCVFESGGTEDPGVAFIPLECRLRRYLADRRCRRIWIRRVKAPLTPEQTQCLRAFAQMQDGKRFASYCRLCMLSVPGRPLRPTTPEQCRWFCAELVCEALRTCGMCPACWMVPEKTTPQELFNDKRDISCGWHLPETWSPDCNPPPAGPPCAPR